MLAFSFWVVDERSLWLHYQKTIQKAGGDLSDVY